VHNKTVHTLAESIIVNFRQACLSQGRKDLFLVARYRHVSLLAVVNRQASVKSVGEENVSLLGFFKGQVSLVVEVVDVVVAVVVVVVVPLACETF
jgi:hypothetical protein